MLDAPDSLVDAMPVAPVHLETAIESCADRMSSSVLDDITARSRSHLRSVEIVAPPTWETWCVACVLIMLSPQDPRLRPGRDRPVRSARVARHPRRSLARGAALQGPRSLRRLALLASAELHGHLLAHLAFEPRRSGARVIRRDAARSTASPLGMRPAEVVDELRAAGVAMLPSEDQIARGPSVVRRPLTARI